MARVSDLLSQLKEGNGRDCSFRVGLLEEVRQEYISEVVSTVYTAMLGAREVQNFPSLAMHLADVLQNKLYDDANFVKISGFKLDDKVCTLYEGEPDLSSLGTFDDWLSMQEAGGSSFSSTGHVGWRYYYHQFLTGSTIKKKDGKKSSKPKKDEGVYPSIMRARLDWGQSEGLAPYWYFYDKAVSTSRVFPSQHIVHLSDKIKDITVEFCRKLNSTDETPAEAVVDTEDFGRKSERFIDDVFDGKYTTPIPEPEIRLVYGGAYKGKKLSEQEFEQLIKSGEISVSRAYYDSKGNLRMNYQETGTRYWTGLYRIMKK